MPAKFYGESVRLTEFGVQFVMRTLQGEIGTYESFIWTYQWAIVLSVGTLGLWVHINDEDAKGCGRWDGRALLVVLGIPTLAIF